MRDVVERPPFQDATRNEIDSIVLGALRELPLELERLAWNGRRERELVSVFCFGPLRERISNGSLLRDSRQISIEVPVPAPPGSGAPSLRTGRFTSPCDIVIWPPTLLQADALDARPDVRPLAILEWKHARSALPKSGRAQLERMRDQDAEWLAEHSRSDPSFVGYAVLTSGVAGDLGISFRRCARGEIGTIEHVVAAPDDRPRSLEAARCAVAPPTPGAIDRTVRHALRALRTELIASARRPRIEREMVSRFCFGPLLEQVRPGSWLADATQIGIEVAIPQVADQLRLSGRTRSKAQVCKDIVIWPRPGMHCWNASGRPEVRPSVVIEWKHEADPTALDIPWLERFSKPLHPFVGYAVRSSLRAGVELRVVRVRSGVAEAVWTVED